MESKKSVLLADDHALIREGLRQVIEQNKDYHIIEADNGNDALRIIREKKPHIAILDIDMPGINGFEVAKRVHNEGISIDIIFLTMHKDESLFNKAMDIGVKGYVLKENTVTEILKSVDIVLAGKHYLSPEISDFLINRNTKLATPATDKEGLHLLTPAEKNILKLLATMKTNQEMAEMLNVSIKTVQNHRHNICSKLDISGTHALLKFAIEHSEQL
mgnify:CR=1 FL=1|tara:strand:+ start:21290 stop:21940 length:651 start_codon:yes stop_codon:yes gene_type:complete